MNRVHNNLTKPSQAKQRKTALFCTPDNIIYSIHRNTNGSTRRVLRAPIGVFSYA